MTAAERAKEKRLQRIRFALCVFAGYDVDAGRRMQKKPLVGTVLMQFQLVDFHVLGEKANGQHKVVEILTLDRTYDAGTDIVVHIHIDKFIIHCL